MLGRRLLTPVAALALLVPCVAGDGAGSARGKLLPDLPQHLEFAQRDLSNGEISAALAHLSLVLMEKPITYRVTFSGVPNIMHSTCRDAFADAVDLWEAAFPNEIRFIEVAEGPVDLTVTFEPDVRQGESKVAGIVNWKRRVIPSRPATCQLIADMHLRIVQPNGRYMQVEHMRHTAAHELGHVLGLDDSPYFGDIMGPLDLGRPAAGFETAELESLRAVRAQAHEVKLRAEELAINR